jgi:hypothetical protein
MILSWLFGAGARRAECCCDGSGTVKVVDVREDGAKGWEYEACPAKKHRPAILTPLDTIAHAKTSW